MKVVLAKSSGFCMGVRRAMELALEAVNNRPGAIYSYGPLIHNPQALDLLRNKGLRVLQSGASGLQDLEKGTVIIRAHGVPPEERRRLEETGLDIIDATCPRVIRVQMIIKRHAEKGYTPVIWGNPDHPEVVGLLGYSEGKGLTFNKPEDVAALPDRDKVILVAQTTQNQQMWEDVVKAVTTRWPEALVFDTICGATQRRQEEARRLAREVDAMVIVGGHNSGNTTRLAAVAEEEGAKTIHVETEDELDQAWLAGVGTVGITAGASTPNWMIIRLFRALERFAQKGDPSIKGKAHRLLRNMVLSNFFVALGAGILCLAAAMLQGIEPRPAFFGVAFFYVHAMHMLNMFLDKEASQYNDPDRALFLETYRHILISSGIFSALAGLLLGLTLGWGVFSLLAFMSTLGLLYAVPLVPHSLAKRIRLRRLKDIPSSKTLFLSGGWALALSCVPALSPEGELTWSTAVVGLICFLLVFIRSAFGDIFEIQGDRIAGRETIPIIIGEAKTINLLKLVVLVLAAALTAGWAAGLLTSLALVLLVCAAYAGLHLFLFRRDQIVGGTISEAMIDANFILAGILSLLWAVFQGGMS